MNTIVVETTYLFTTDCGDFTDNIIKFQTIDGYPATPAGQPRMLAEYLSILRAVPNGRGLSSSGGKLPGWSLMAAAGIHSTPSRQQLREPGPFAFDDRPLPAMDCFSRP